MILKKDKELYQVEVEKQRRRRETAMQYQAQNLNTAVDMNPLINQSTSGK
jgi:hypothetical protein